MTKIWVISEALKLLGFPIKMWLEAEKMRENENPRETLKHLRAGFFIN